MVLEEGENGGYSNIGNSYQAPLGIKYDTFESKSYLAGSRNFKVLEIEVYKVYKDIALNYSKFSD